MSNTQEERVGLCISNFQKLFVKFCLIGTNIQNIRIVSTEESSMTTSWFYLFRLRLGDIKSII